MINLSYKGKSFNQRENDGYVNLGQLCATHGKKFSNWSRLNSSGEYLQALAETLAQSHFSNISTGDLIVSTIGGKDGSQTWGHPLVAIEVARWISPKFGVWLDVAMNPAGLLNKFSHQKSQKDDSGFVYLAIASQTRWCKIGMSKQPYKRMSSLQTGSPLEITLIHRIFTFDMVALEKALHDYYAAYSLRGEWFDLPAECIREFPAIANQLDTAIEQICLPQ